MYLEVSWCHFECLGHPKPTQQTHEKRRLSMVSKGWTLILEAWRSSGLRCRYTEWQLAGWPMGWRGVAGGDWEAGWPLGPQDLRQPGREKVNGYAEGAQNHTFIKNASNHSTSGLETRARTRKQQLLRIHLLSLAAQKGPADYYIIIL